MNCIDKFTIAWVYKKYGLDLSDLIRRKQAYDYLDKYMIVSKSADKGETTKHQAVIWQYWDDEYKIPAIVKSCMDSVKRNSTCQVILMSDKNRSQYVQLPDYIEEKYYKGIISHNHFSDILRVALLAEHGGTWMDATVYCTDTIPEEYLNCGLFLFQSGPWKMYDFENIIRCSSWFITANSTNKLIRSLRDSLYKFWESENEARDYFLFHILIGKLLDSNAKLLREWKDMPFADTQYPHYLISVMNRNFTQEEWDKVKSISPVHKLTYKQKHTSLNSIYRKILNDEIR